MRVLRQIKKEAIIHVQMNKQSVARMDHMSTFMSYFTLIVLIPSLEIVKITFSSRMQTVEHGTVMCNCALLKSGKSPAVNYAPEVDSRFA